MDANIWQIEDGLEWEWEWEKAERPVPGKLEIRAELGKPVEVTLTIPDSSQEEL